MSLKIGSQLGSPASTAEVVVVRGTESEGTLLCAGAPMQVKAEAGSPAAEGPALAVGKRYADEGSGIELLIVKPGVGPLEFAGKTLELKTAKQLPASD